MFGNNTFRKRKIGMYLIDTLFKHLSLLGYREVYLKTESAANYYQNRGWKFVESVLDDQNVNLDIFKYNLANLNR